VDDNAHETTLHNDSEAGIRTDVGQHIHLVSSSGRGQEICAMKIWRERNSLDFPSLSLELTVLEALAGQRFGQLADNVLAVLRYMARRFRRMTVRDPANEDNVISDRLTANEKQRLAKKRPAKRCLVRIGSRFCGKTQADIGKFGLWAHRTLEWYELQAVFSLTPANPNWPRIHLRQTKSRHRLFPACNPAADDTPLRAGSCKKRKDGAASVVVVKNRCTDRAGKPVRGPDELIRNCIEEGIWHIRSFA